MHIVYGQRQTTVLKISNGWKKLTFVKTHKSAVIGVGLMLGLLTALALLPFPEIFDCPITTFMNTHIVSSPLADVLILTIHHRPLHDPELSFHLPSVVDPNTLNMWNALPSDHAVAWFGLAMLILIASPKLGLLALTWAFATLVPRNYLGFHYPTDIIGGAALGSLAVWLSQLEALQWLPRRVVGWGDRHIPVFYTGAFFRSYQISTLFDDVRALAGSIVKILHVAPILVCRARAPV